MCFKKRLDRIPITLKEISKWLFDSEDFFSHNSKAPFNTHTKAYNQEVTGIKLV